MRGDNHLWNRGFQIQICCFPVTSIPQCQEKGKDQKKSTNPLLFLVTKRPSGFFSLVQVFITDLINTNIKADFKHTYSTRYHAKSHFAYSTGRCLDFSKVCAIILTLGIGSANKLNSWFRGWVERITAAQLNKRMGCKSPRCRRCKCRDGLPLTKVSHWKYFWEGRQVIAETQVRRSTETGCLFVPVRWAKRLCSYAGKRLRQ